MVAIDISYAQTTNINFVVMRSSVDTVILKAGGSNTGSRYVDSKYRWFEPRARAAGMRMGHYWFNGYGDPVGDADFFVNNLSGYQPGDLLALDIESEGSMGYASPSWALAFVNRVKQRTGRDCDVYMSSSVTRAQNWSAVKDAGSKLWVAQYGTNSGAPQGSPNIAYWPTYKLWQYSSNGSVPGYAARVDVNTVNEAEWAGGNPTPIIENEEEDMKIISVPNGTIALVGPTSGVKYTSVSGGQGFSIGANKKVYGEITGLTEDEVTTLVNEANARGAALKPVMSDAQITALANQVASKIVIPDASDVALDDIRQAVTDVVVPAVNNAVTALSQDNANQTASLKGLTYKAV